MSLLKQPIEIEQAAEAAKLIYEVSKVSRLLYTDLDPNVSAVEFIRREICKEHSKLSYRNCVSIEEDNLILGLANYYPTSQEAEQTSISAEFEKRMLFLEKLFASEVKNSLYISAIIVNGNLRRQGVGQQLIAHLSQEAIKLGLNGISLHCWLDNHPAMRFYEKLGFKHCETVTIGRHPHNPFDGSAALLHLE